MNKIKELRVERGLTQAELATLLGVNQTAVGKYEREELEPNIQTLVKLSKIFEVSVDYIICNTDDFGCIIIKTENINALAPEEQNVVNLLRKNSAYELTEFVNMYTKLPTYMQESIFAELKGMNLGYAVSKAKRNEN